MSGKQFKKNIHNAISNPNLNTALDRAEKAYIDSRPKAFEGLDFEVQRTHLRKCKEDAIKQNQELFLRFRKEAEDVSVKVYQAADANEAVKIVLDLAKSRGAKKIVKSKSMLTEEIELNRHLIAEGMEVTETDLGEWIIQLAGERPSHFTTPAIHKTKEEVAEIFSKVVGEKVDPEISNLVEVARKQIRQAFIEADIGISGANIAIADTGTLVIVSNEGNARLVTSLPYVHIALVGYEKLVPSIDEAAAVLKLLSKSGTGQKMTSYVSFITGASRTSDIEKTLTLGCHGPRELHIIFVDNGRLQMLGEPDFREAGYCIKCGACLYVCPVYRSVGGHVFGSTYMGGIGSILTAFCTGLSEAEDISSLCMTCGKCKSFCPVKIDVPKMIVNLRGRLMESKGQPWMQKAIFKYLLGSPERFNLAIDLGRKAQTAFGIKGDSIKNLPFPLSGLTGFRSVPVIADKPLHNRLPKLSEAEGKEKLGTVAFYPGCVIDQIYPEIGEAVVRVIKGLGWDVLLPENQGCCGIPALVKGDIETARNLAMHNMNIKDFQSADYIITACPTCSKAWKTDFVEIFKQDSEYSKLSAKLAEKVRDFSEFLLNEGGLKQDDLENADGDPRVTYHDPCHARYGFGIFKEPRELLTQAGYEIAEMKNSDTCCGFAGSFSLSYPEISASILKRKITSIVETDAPIVSTACPGCLLQLRGGLEKAGYPVQVRHIAELIDRVLKHH